MALTSSLLYSPLIQSFDPFSKTRTSIKPSSNRTKTSASASRRDQQAHHNHNFSGRLVDENMIVLRKRIHETKMIEENHETPSEWMDWEKRFYESYDPIICDAMGHLQTYLMETRPSLVLGMVALVALSVPTSSAVVIYNLFRLIK